MSTKDRPDGRHWPLTLALSPRAGRVNVNDDRIANRGLLSSNAAAGNGRSAIGGSHVSPSPRIVGRRWPAGRMPDIVFERNRDNG